MPADVTHEAEELPRFRLDHVPPPSRSASRSARFRSYICTRFGLGTYNLFVITVITVILANIAPRQFAKLEGDFALGMLCMYAFFAMIGAGTDALGFIRSAPMLFIYCTFMLVVHFIVLLLVAKLVKFDLAEVIIGSGAAIVGPAASAGIASAKGWKTLLTPAHHDRHAGLRRRELRRHRDLPVAEMRLATHVALPGLHRAPDVVRRSATMKSPGMPCLSAASVTANSAIRARSRRWLIP